jgi:hypothetical protein
MDPPVVKVTTGTTPATTKGPSATNDKTKGPSDDGITKPKATKPDLIGKMSKVKSGKLPAKEKKPEEGEKATVKKDDTKDKRPDTKENKPEVKVDAEKPDTKGNKFEKKDDSKDKSIKGKSPHRLPSLSGDHCPSSCDAVTNIHFDYLDPEITKGTQGVKLPDLVKPAPSDSDSSSEDDSEDYENSNDSDSMDDSDDSDESSETSESEMASDIDGFDEALYNAFALEYQDLEDLSPERLAMEKAKTLRRVQAFVDNTKDKHYHEFKLETLTGPHNYIRWVVGLEVLLRMHQVWSVVGELDVPLDKDHEMYPWYEHMVNTAVSLIYAHVSQKIRSHRCFISGVMQRSPGSMMQHIWAHFGRPDADQYEH